MLEDFPIMQTIGLATIKTINHPQRFRHHAICIFLGVFEQGGGVDHPFGWWWGVQAALGCLDCLDSPGLPDQYFFSGILHGGHIILGQCVKNAFFGPFFWTQTISGAFVRKFLCTGGGGSDFSVELNSKLGALHLRSVLTNGFGVHTLGLHPFLISDHAIM